MSEACVILNDIHIDIMDYIKPAYCNEAQVSAIELGSLDFLNCSWLVPEHVDRVRMGEQGQRNNIRVVSLLRVNCIFDLIIPCSV
jgi:hypothetical protein